MSCECITKLEDEIVSSQPFEGLKVTRARFAKAMIWSKDQNKLTTKPIISVELTCEGRKLPVRKEVLYSFCPFCGKKYEEEPKTEEAKT